MSTHTIREHGNGLPEVGERVYVTDGGIYTVESIDSELLTRQGDANRILATLRHDCNAGDLDEDEWDNLRDLRITGITE